MKQSPPILIHLYPRGNMDIRACQMRRDYIFDVIGEGHDRLVSIRMVGY